MGRNYTFDKRFNHGAANSVIISNCVNPTCRLPWDRYQAAAKCAKCSMEVLLCKSCQKLKPAVKKGVLFCPLCDSSHAK